MFSKKFYFCVRFSIISEVFHETIRVETFNFPADIYIRLLKIIEWYTYRLQYIQAFYNIKPR